MAKRTVVGVGRELPGGVGEYVPLLEKRSLLDWDIIIFCPELTPFLDYSVSYQGKPSLSERGSVTLRESAEHWNREVAEALRIGKSVFVLLGPQEQVFIDTGQRQYSGTGRNRQPIRVVAPFYTYQLLPSLVSLVSSEGKELRLADGQSLLGDYWRVSENRSSYKVLIDSNVSQPLIVTRSGAKVAGALIRLKDSTGALVLFPYIDLSADEFLEERKVRGKGKNAEAETEYVWSTSAAKFGNEWRDCLLSIDEALRQGAPEPPPAWSGDARFLLPREVAIQEELLVLETDVANLIKRRDVLKQELEEEGALKRLLYEKGTLLEDAIARALRLMGFTATPYRDAKSEFDVVFESPEGRLIGEAEGKDNKSINIDKLRQLQMNLHEDFAREEVLVMAQGVLFANAYRLTPIADRSEFFTEKVMSAAEQNGCILVRTPDLFRVAQDLSRNPDAEFARACRSAIVASKGRIVAFPSIPDAEAEAPNSESSVEPESAT